MPTESIQDLSRLLVVRLPHRLPTAKIRLSIRLAQPSVVERSPELSVNWPWDGTAVTEREHVLRLRPSETSLKRA